MRAVLVDDMPEVARCLTEDHDLRARTGGNLIPYDKRALDQIGKALAADDYHFQTLILEAVPQFAFPIAARFCRRTKEYERRKTEGDSPEIITRKAPALIEERAAQTQRSARFGFRRGRTPFPGRDGSGIRRQLGSWNASRSHGVLRRPNGTIMDAWNPDYEGRLGELPRSLKALEPFKEDVLQSGNLTSNT